MLYYTVLYYTITILYYTITILYCTILLLYYTVLYYTILYYTITILYYTIGFTPHWRCLGWRLSDFGIDFFCIFYSPQLIYVSCI
jgi:hypothetical protein